MKKTTRKESVARAGIGGQIIDGLKEAVAFEQGDRAGSRAYRVKLTARAMCAPAAPAYGAQQVKQIRTKLGLSQAVFGMALNVSTETVRAWEQGKNQPGGPAERLLEIADKHPGFIHSVVRSRDEDGQRGT